MIIQVNPKIRIDIYEGIIRNLSKSEEPIQLDNLEHKVITLLIDNENKIVTYSELWELWRSPNVSDSAISRVISLLRKKLKRAGVEDQVIVNVPKRGYKFISPLSQAGELSNAASETKSILINNKPKHSSRKYFLVSLSLALMTMILTFIFVNKTFINQSIDIELGNITRLYQDNTLKVNNIISNDGEYSAFIYKKANNWLLKIINNHNGEVSVLKEKGDVFSPSFLSSSQLVYRLRKGDSCQIKVVSIISGKFGTATDLFSCNAETIGMGTAKLDTDILFTNAPLGKFPSKVYKGNLKSGKLTEVKLPELEGIGVYHISTVDNSSLVVLLSSLDMKTTTISLLDSSENWELKWQAKLEQLIYSVAWNGDILTYKESESNLNFVKFDKDFREVKRKFPLMDHIYSINKSPSGLNFIKGEIMEHYFKVIDNSNNKVIDLESVDGFKIELAKFLDSERLIYVSDSYSEKQLWIYDFISGQASKLVRPNGIKLPLVKDIVLNEFDNHLAIETTDSILLYKIEGNELILEQNLKGRSPTFWNDELVFVQSLKGSFNIMKTTGNYSNVELFIDDGAEVKASKDKLIYRKYSQQGFWEYKLDNADKHILHSVKAYVDWQLQNNILLIRRDEQWKNAHSGENVTVTFGNDCNELIDSYGQKCIVKLSRPGTLGIYNMSLK